MDASFKQYQYTQGMDLGTNVPLDGQALVNQLQQSATVNEAEGWVSNVDQTLVQQALTNYQNQVTSYVNSQNPNATLGDVIGTQTIVQQSGPILFGTLPYSRVATGAELQVLPDNLRWKFRYAVYASDSDLAQDSPMINLLRSTASVGSQKITLSYSAATPQDQAVIDGIFPTTSFPAYLIHVVPELRVDGQLTASGPPFGLGTELIQVPSYYNPGTGQWEPGEPNRATVGEYVVTALDLQGIGSGQLTTLTSRIAQTQATLQQVAQNPADPTPLQTLTKEAVTGDLLYSGLLYYFLSIDSSGQLIAQRAKVVTQRMPSFGNFGVASQVLFLFGVPRTINFSGVLLDIDRVTAADVSKDATSNTVVTFRMAAGSQYSALEHLIPEKLFHISSLPPDDPSQPQAVSAVKALAVAAAQGQRIYTLNSTNEAIHASTISQLGIDAAVKDEISNALAAGKQVTVHQADITYAGFTGSGYVIIDPQTGAGAYKISGGASGAFSKLIVLLLTILMELGNIAVAVLSETGGLLIDAFKTAFSMRDSFEKCDPPAGAWLAGLAVAFFVASILIAMPFTILIAGAWGVLLGAIAAALFSALFDKLIDAMRRNLCGRGPRRRPDFAW
jgi:hypothetical protein